MPKKYQPAIFQPTIRPSWSGSLEYINAEELAQILKAITAFPNIDLPDSAFWNKTVKPDLEQQYQTFKETCESRGRGARTYWNKEKDKDNLSSTQDIDKDNLSITKGKLRKDKDKDKDNININNNNNNNILSGIREKKFVPPTEQEVLEYAKSMHEARNIGGFYCSKNMAESFYGHYASQNWIIGNGIPMWNWQKKLKEWSLKQQKIDNQKERLC